MRLTGFVGNCFDQITLTLRSGRSPTASNPQRPHERCGNQKCHCLIPHQPLRLLPLWHSDHRPAIKLTELAVRGTECLDRFTTGPRRPHSGRTRRVQDEHSREFPLRWPRSCSWRWRQRPSLRRRPSTAPRTSMSTRPLRKSPLPSANGRKRFEPRWQRCGTVVNWIRGTVAVESTLKPGVVARQEQQPSATCRTQPACCE